MSKPEKVVIDDNEIDDAETSESRLDNKAKAIVFVVGTLIGVVGAIALKKKRNPKVELELVEETPAA